MKRTYTQRVRAESTARTRDRILDAVAGLSLEWLTVEIGLADVAERAGVSVQTVLRHFDTKDALFDAAWARMADQVLADRATPSGDVRAAVTAVVNSYERTGDWSVRLQAQEHSVDLARRTVAIGRSFHRAWVEQAFAPQLAGSAHRTELLDLLIISTDVLIWKILRRDGGLSRTATIERMCRLAEAVLDAPPPYAPRN